MIIDDEDDITILTETLLLKAGFDVISFNKAKNALVYLKKNNVPDLILLDLRMPDMSGLDFLRKIENNEFLRNIRIVFFTATAELIKDKLDNFNIVGEIRKPFDIDKFTNEVKKYLKK